MRGAVAAQQSEAQAPALSRSLKDELEALYREVPATGCASSGECCTLTDEEYRGTFATMFPLYRIEYLNLVDQVTARFAAGEREELLAYTEERPRRCPFLSADHRCTAYPARPLICRTYGVMNSESIAGAAEAQRGRFPRDWVEGFVLREGGMSCPRVRVLEPEKVARHAANLIDGTYERELTRLSGKVELAEGERREIFQRVTGRAAWPWRWTWGGYNAVRHAPLDWLRAGFAEYWERAWLVDAG